MDIEQKRKIADFHSDYLTNENSMNNAMQYIENDVKVVGAIFKGKRTFSEVYEIAKSFRKKFGYSEPIAFEEISFSLSEIEKLLEFKPEYATLTWNYENQLGYGCFLNGGLKPKGFDVIKLLNEHGVAVDVAHSSNRGFFDIMENAETVVNSHTCFGGVCEHPRNMSDEELKMLNERKCLVGLTLYKPFLTRENIANVTTVFKHVDYFVQKYEYEHLCIGSDFFGATDFPVGVENYKGFSELGDYMISKGYSKNAVDAILNDNLRLFLNKKQKST